MKPRIAVTVDTCVLLDILDKGSGSRFCKLIEWHDSGRIEVAVSNRVRGSDTRKMQEKQRDELGCLLRDHSIKICPAPFRLGFSTLGGGDALGGPKSSRSPEEVAKFRKIVGLGPTFGPASKKVSNEVGDYDALQGDFIAKRHVFLTLDRRGYFAAQRREIYIRELGLIVQSPEEFIASQQSAPGPIRKV
jgi:hypothetical protein